MLVVNVKYRLSVVLSAFILCLSSASGVLADQVMLTYVDADSSAQSLTLDCNTSIEDLALAASLVGEEGVNLLHAPDDGCGSVADLAAAMAAAAPVFAASIAQAFALMSPDDAEAIVAAVNAVAGVNTSAVVSAVHFGPAGTNVGPQSIGSGSAIGPEVTDPANVLDPLPPPGPEPSAN